MRLRIVIVMQDIRLRPERVVDFVSAYSKTDMGELEDGLLYSHATRDFLVVELEGLPTAFDSVETFQKSYLARIREIAAPMMYQLN